MTWITTEAGAPIATEGGSILVTESNFTPTLPLQTIIESYLYQEYADDLDLQAFVASQNALAQSYLDWFNATPLGLYTSPNLTGALLDFVAQGLYGIERPVFASSFTKYVAGLNALPLNVVAIDGHEYLQSGTAEIASDDYFKRVLTWWLYIGNGRHFDLTLLRRKVARFLYAPNGSDITLSQAQTVHIAAGTLALSGAPTLSSSAGGALPTREYGVRESYVTPVGEGLAGAPGSRTVLADNVLLADSPVPESGAISYNVYVNVLSTNPTHYAAGINALPVNAAAINGTNKLPVLPPTKQNPSPIPIGTNWLEPTSGLIVGAPLPVADNSNTPANLIITIPAGTASSLFAQAMGQGILSFPFQLSASVVIT